MELKSISTKENVSVTCSNRTFMELKLDMDASDVSAEEF